MGERQEGDGRETGGRWEGDGREGDGREGDGREGDGSKQEGDGSKQEGDGRYCYEETDPLTIGGRLAGPVRWVRGCPWASLQKGNRERAKARAWIISCLVTLKMNSLEVSVNPAGQKLT